jgi:catalase
MAGMAAKKKSSPIVTPSPKTSGVRTAEAVRTPSSERESGRGQAAELHQFADSGDPKLTTNQGLPISDNQNSLRAHARGPTLLEDFILREKITHFDHERIPERIVHARGVGAHGTFTLHRSLEKYTRARVLCEVGVEVPVFVRFSTVAGGAGSVDTPRDVRGFAVKFYTEEGNWDLVGNNIPVFFIQDAIKFPDLIHAVKMEPDRGFPQSATAHDTFWDFISLTPESMHMVMWIMSDRTIPRSLFNIEGFGVHSFRLVRQDGGATFVKFHWRPELGLASTVWDEAVKIAGSDPDFHRRQLFEALGRGEKPAWKFCVQLFTEEQAEDFDFDHLDATKLIPEEVVPLLEIGRMELTRYVDNFFAETEQVAFCPSHVVPGIDFSDDPLLQGRLFSYLDTQLSRLGTPNFHQLPINAPRCPFANLQRDGRMQMQIPKGRIAYEPNSLEPGRGAPEPPRQVKSGFESFGALGAAEPKVRVRSETFADHYSQGRLFYRSQTESEQAHIAFALVLELSKVETPHVRMAMVAHLRNVDEDLAERVAYGLGIDELPEAASAAQQPIDLLRSDSLSIHKNAQATLKGRSVGILVAEGSDKGTVQKLKATLAREGAHFKVIAPRLKGFAWADGTIAEADAQLAGTPSVFFDAVALVLSDEGAQALAKEAAAVDFVRDAYGHLKAIGVTDDADSLLNVAGVSVDPGTVDLDDMNGFLTAAKTRQWDREPELRTLP